MPCMPKDELPVDVLTELGRLTWAAIKLEDYVVDICSRVEPKSFAEDLNDRRPVSGRIRDATKVMADWTDPSPRAGATAWLERASLALERRNAALHATPVAQIRPGVPKQLALGEMPRKGRPYAERPLTVESLGELRSVLEDAAAGWLDLAGALAQHSGSLKIR